MTKIKEGDTVKFKDSLWASKKLLGKDGLFGPPLPDKATNEFVVVLVNPQDEENIEVRLKNYPWLVYADELKLLKKESK